MPIFTPIPSVPAGRAHPLSLLLAVMLLGLGTLVGWAGVRAIRTQRYDSHWEEERDVALGPVEVGVDRREGVDHFRGERAVEIGAGLAGTGALFFLWGLGVAWAVVRPEAWRLKPRPGMVVVALSMVIQTVALVGLLPPWRIGDGAAPACWLTLVLLLFVVVARVRFGGELSTEMRHASRAVAIVALIIGVGVMLAQGGSWWLGCVVAFFAAVSYGMHGFIIAVTRRRVV